MHVLQHQHLQKKSFKSCAITQFSLLPGTLVPCPATPRQLCTGQQSPCAAWSQQTGIPSHTPSTAAFVWLDVLSLCSANYHCVTGQLASCLDVTPVGPDPAASHPPRVQSLAVLLKAKASVKEIAQGPICAERADLLP